MITPSGISHSYDQGIAVDCQSVTAAVLYTNICLWIKHNILAGHERINGRTWTFQSVAYIAASFPEFSEKQIRDALDILVEKKLLIKDHLSKNKFDRTSWYALPDETILKLERFSKNVFDTPCRANAGDPQGKCNKVHVDNIKDISSKLEDIKRTPVEKIFVSPDLEPEDAKKGTLKMPQAKWDDFVAKHGEARVIRCAQELSNYLVNNHAKYKKHYLALATFIRNSIEREEVQKAKEFKEKKNFRAFSSNGNYPKDHEEIIC